MGDEGERLQGESSRKGGTRQPPAQALRPRVEAIQSAMFTLQSLVLNEQGRIEAREHLATLIAELDASGEVASLTDQERNVVAGARDALAQYDAAPDLLVWLAPSPPSTLLAPPASATAPSNEERLTGVLPLVRQTVADVDDKASGKVLLADCVSNRSWDRVVRWALELQRIRHSPKGNYLHAWYLLLYEDYPNAAKGIGQRLADQGIAFGPTAWGFTSLEHLDPREPLPPRMNAAVEKLPMGNFVDAFAKVDYDVEYRPKKRGWLSEYLVLTYSDGVTIDLDISLISDNRDPAPIHAQAYSYVGAGERVFPLRLGPDTTPRLWKAKQWAYSIMQGYNEDFEFFVSLSLAGVMSNLPIGPVTMPEPTPTPGRPPPGRPRPGPATVEAETPGVTTGATKGATQEPPAATTTAPTPTPTNTNVFHRSVEFTPTTGRTYKVFQRNDINWDQIRTAGDRRFIGKTNAEAAREGLRPQLPDGNFATLHHSQQSAEGPWFEVSTKVHNIRTAKQPPLHPYRGEQHPDFPLGKGAGSRREQFQTIESPEYWKWREQHR